jgi:DNA-binding transcriptional MocR family regulator
VKSYLYQELSDSIRNDIKSGQRQPGERMPSLRALCLAKKLSKSTVLNAYSYLEMEGLLESRPRSGYFVKALYEESAPIMAQLGSNPDSVPLAVSTDKVMINIMERGAAFDLLPSKDDGNENRELLQCLSRAYRRQSSYQQNYYNPPQGSEELRRQIINQLHAGGSHLHSDDIIITSGCQSALLMALMATTKPGDVVAIESPGFYGAIQLIEALGLRILELPSSPTGGIDIDSIEDAFKRWQVSVLIVSPCYSTPTGSCISDNDKQSILALCISFDVTIIEDDIYGELTFGLSRPRTLHSYDEAGNVLLCSSLSKCLSRDLRIGWIAPGKYQQEISRLKIITSLSTSGSLQAGIADYMQRGFFERYLRKKRLHLSKQCQQLQHLIPKLLPTALSWTRPAGGLTLWLELPQSVNTTDLYRQAQEKGITITPGALFTSQHKYRNFLRLSFAHEWTEGRISALAEVGDILAQHT